MGHVAVVLYMYMASCTGVPNLATIQMDSIASFILLQLEGKGSCDMDIDQSAGSMVM